MIGTRAIPAEIRPGSFSKNYGFESVGPGFEKLRLAIKHCFSNTPRDLKRSEFRSRHSSSIVGPELISLNFFLFNYRRAGDDWIAVDELVISALGAAGTEQFDSLAFVAFHLNCVGTWRGADSWQSRPTSWAALFVEAKLDPGKVWGAQVTKSEIEPFLSDTMQYGSESPTKFSTNYAALFRYGRYAGSSPDQRKQRFIQFGRSATFLLLDRQSLTEGNFASQPSNPDFKYLALVMGVEHNWAFEYFAKWIAVYQMTGGLARIAANPSLVTTTLAGPAAVDQATLAESDADVEYSIVQGLKRKRDTAIAATLKHHYGFLCQVCNSPLLVDIDDRLYCEAAHVRPLGKPHLGPDTITNLLALCPNHHIQLDRGVISLAAGTSSLQTVSAYPSLAGLPVKLRPPHALAQEHIDYHRNVIFLQAS